VLVRRRSLGALLGLVDAGSEIGDDAAGIAIARRVHVLAARLGCGHCATRLLAVGARHDQDPVAVLGVVDRRLDVAVVAPFE
jgi:hypothetical protein